MKRVFTALAAVMMLIITGCSKSEKLVIMHTNDVHGNVIVEHAEDRGGMLRAKVVIDSIRNAEENTMLIDAGDDVQGFLYFTLFGGKVEYTLMDKMGYDIIIPGNHEFDNGVDSLASNYKNINTEILCANYDFENPYLKERVKPYSIKEFGGKRIAFIGVGCHFEGLVLAKNAAGVKYTNALQITDSIAGALKASKQADYAIAVTHIGYSSKYDLPNDSAMAVNSRYIDVIIGGHSHTTVKPGNKGENAPILNNLDGKPVLIGQTGAFGKSMGKITIDLNDLSKLPEYELIPIDSKYDSRIDPELKEWVEPYEKEVQALNSQVIGQTDVAFADINESVLPNFVTDMIYDIASSLTPRKVDFAIGNMGGIRHPMPKGDISAGFIMSMLPFPNCVLVMEISGKDLKEALDVMARRGGDALSKQITVGMKDGKAAKVSLNGKDIDPNRTYLIATIDYLANGGDHMTPLTRGKVIRTSDHLFKFDAVDYIKAITARGEKLMGDSTQRMYYVK